MRSHTSSSSSPASIGSLKYDVGSSGRCGGVGGYGRRRRRRREMGRRRRSSSSCVPVSSWVGGRWRALVPTTTTTALSSAEDDVRGCSAPPSSTIVAVLDGLTQHADTADTTTFKRKRRKDYLRYIITRPRIRRTAPSLFFFLLSARPK